MTAIDYGPDVCFWKKATSRHFASDQLIYPVPGFICEVLSPSTARTDRVVKFRDYEHNRVAEYWMADPATRRIEQLVLRGERYEPAGTIGMKGTIRSHVVKGFEMPVRAAFDGAAYLAAMKRLLAA